MNILVDTQGYAQFVLDRIERPENDYEIMFFDESIKQKLNRSRMRFSKEATPFLNENTYQISTKVMAMHFNTDDVPYSDSIVLGPFDWKPQCVTDPREFNPLLTEADRQMMRSHTNEVVQRSRIVSMINQRGKQDFSKWVKSKWKIGKATNETFSSDDQRRFNALNLGIYSKTD